jgi:branched-chain amino acid transport system substrate-binding protein
MNKQLNKTKTNRIFGWTDLLQNRPKTVLIALSLILGIITLGLVATCQAFSTDDALYIAVVGPMTGDDERDGADMVKGIRLYLDQVNEAGGIDGKRVELLEFDDQNDKGLARKKALEIVEQDKVLLVLGHYFSSTSLAGGELYKEAGIPAISGSATAGSVTEGNDWYFRVTFSNHSQAVFSANSG